jgi:hypothetical protein
MSWTRTEVQHLPKQKKIISQHSQGIRLPVRIFSERLIGLPRRGSNTKPRSVYNNALTVRPSALIVVDEG